MASIFVKKAIASALSIPNEQVDAILSMAEAFKSNEIDRKLAERVFNKVAKKTPSEINAILKGIEDEA